MNHLLSIRLFFSIGCIEERRVRGGVSFAVTEQDTVVNLVSHNEHRHVAISGGHRLTDLVHYAPKTPP